MFACSATCSAACSSSRKASRCSTTSSGCAALRAPRGRRAAGRARRRGRRAARSSGRRACCARSRPYFQLANVAEQQHRIRRRRAYAHEERVLAESLAASFARLERRAARTRSQRRVSLELVLTAHPTEAARRTVLTAHLRIAALLAELDDPLLSHARATRSRPSSRRDHDALADGRGALEATARRRRDPERPLVLRAEPDRRRRAPARRLPHAPAGRAGRRFGFGTWIGGDADGNPNAGRRDGRARRSSGRARCCARATATRCGRSPPRSACRRGSSRSTTSCRVDRARRARAARVRGGDRRPEPRRAVSPEALVHVAAPRRATRTTSAERALRKISRCSTAACARTAAHASPTARSRRCAGASSSSAFISRRSTCACTRATSSNPTRASASSSTRSPRLRRRHGAQALDTVIVSGTTSAEDVLRVRDADRRAAVARAALRVGRGAARRAAHLRGAARRGRAAAR